MSQPDHKAVRQYSDEYQCSHCGKTWDVNDPEPPPCTTLATAQTPVKLRGRR